MKLTKYLFLFLTCLIVSACGDDKKGPIPPPKEERPEALAWIEDTMRENYYWYKEIPAGLNYESDEETFFYSLLSTKDGKKASGGNPYSYIENMADRTRSSIQEYYSYGIEFGVRLFVTETRFIVLILYVVPGSPADDKGLERGDWILKVDDKEMTSYETYIGLLGGPKKRLTVARWDTDLIDLNPGTQEVVNGITFVDKREVELEAARAVVDDPVYFSDIITRGDRTIGYLLYNRFEVGTSGTDQSYDNKLRNVSRDFRAAGVNEMVLDLRYNNGGAVSSAILLCAILAPSTYVSSNAILAYLQYNDKQTSSGQIYRFGTTTLSPGVNLNLNRLYVLTSTSTASASEMIINSLSPFMEVVVIGDRTVGKNVGSVTYPNDNDPYPYGSTTWEMHPIVCQISNSDGFTDYEDGFPPNTYNKTNQYAEEVDKRLVIDEAFDYKIDNGKTYAILTKTYPLGDENERMLKVALGMIDGTYTRSAMMPSSGGKGYKVIPGSSIDRKATNAVIIDIK